VPSRGGLSSENERWKTRFGKPRSKLPAHWKSIRLASFPAGLDLMKRRAVFLGKADQLDNATFHAARRRLRRQASLTTFALWPFWPHNFVATNWLSDKTRSENQRKARGFGSVSIRHEIRLGLLYVRCLVRKSRGHSGCWNRPANFFIDFLRCVSLRDQGHGFSPSKCGSFAIAEERRFPPSAQRV